MTQEEIDDLIQTKTDLIECLGFVINYLSKQPQFKKFTPDQILSWIETNVSLNRVMNDNMKEGLVQ